MSSRMAAPLRRRNRRPGATAKMLHHRGEDARGFRIAHRKEGEQHGADQRGAEGGADRARELHRSGRLAEPHRTGGVLHDHLHHAHHRAHEQAVRAAAGREMVTLPRSRRPERHHQSLAVASDQADDRINRGAAGAADQPTRSPASRRRCRSSAAPAADRSPRARSPRTTSRNTGMKVMSDTSAAPWQAAIASLCQIAGMRSSFSGMSGDVGAVLVPHQQHERDQTDDEQRARPSAIAPDWRAAPARARAKRWKRKR